MCNTKNLSLLVFFLFFSITIQAQTAEDYFKEGEARSRQQNYNEAIAEYSKAIKAFIDDQAYLFMRRSNEG